MTGRFVWYDYLALDPSAAIAFYGELCGWKTELFPQSPAATPYKLWTSPQGALGGVMQMPDEPRKGGVPPHWMGTVEVDDIEGTLRSAKQLGGTVHVTPMLIPTVGRYGVFADPEGATLSVLQPEPRQAPAPARHLGKHGEFNWNELHARDGRKAFEFYARLFGWKIAEELDMGPAGTYLIYGQGDERYGGVITQSASEAVPPHWLYYVFVDDLDAAIARAERNGGKKHYGPMEVPGGSRIAVVADRDGAAIGLNGPVSA